MSDVLADECYSCGEVPENDCPQSKRPCGHHCNCSWVHDHCHWCDKEFGGGRVTTTVKPDAKPPCWLCGDEIAVHPWRLKYEAHEGGERIALFCSHRCKDLFQRAMEEREDERKDPPPPPACSICGMTEEESQWGVLIPIEVTVLEGEEGYADIMMLLCDEHGAEVCNALMALGFKDHHHGGANLLEDTNCIGRSDMHACPTPTNPYDSDGPTLVPGGGWDAATQQVD